MLGLHVLADLDSFTHFFSVKWAVFREWSRLNRWKRGERRLNSGCRGEDEASMVMTDRSSCNEQRW